MNEINIIFLKKELDKINSIFKKKNFKLVIEKSKKLLKKNTNQPIIYNYIGLSLLEIDNNEKALETFLSANEKIPSNTSILCNIGITYKKIGDLINAKKYFNNALNIDSKHIPSHINLGHLETSLNHNEIATKHYLNAYNLNSNLEEVLTYYILNLSSLGKFEHAKKIISELNIKFPNNTKSYQLFSKIHNYKAKDNHQQKMLEKIEDKNLNYEDQSNLYFALSKSFFDQKNIDKFVSYTIKANDTKYKTFYNYNFNLEENKFKLIKKYFENFQFTEDANDRGENLIFIVGLPRSGTTLLHQIISSHSRVFGAGESHIFADFISNKFKDENSFINFFKTEVFDKDHILSFSDSILSKYKMHNSNKIIVDKMPLNFKWIGIIKILLPRAKIIFSNRNVVDIAFSIYRNMFDSPGLGWTYNQNHLIKYTHLYDDLMFFWHKKLKKTFYESCYEELVANQVDETKKILKFCNLEFEESCINHTKNSAPVSTVSLAQAREKVYKSSVNLSEKYLEYFPFLNKITKKKAP